MQVEGQQEAKKWKFVVIGIIGGPPLLFAWMYPLLPKSTIEWMLSVLVGMVAGAWAVGSAILIQWLQRQTRYRILCLAVAITVAISLGLGIFFMTYEKQNFVARNFSYFGK